MKINFLYLHKLRTAAHMISYLIHCIQLRAAAYMIHIVTTSTATRPATSYFLSLHKLRTAAHMHKHTEQLWIQQGTGP